ncbi:DUF4112 domain-containing protein [Sphingomonas psychrotolerans]|uniref:DUF4112 domain-containing protein n=1 Tax=Sphingomonas psychrotolerans TaxID=1327635 RepID=A0ABU3N4D2_9SPHN|nr:DUF4112 domain-containing protein [Sphingomonas psychrotolerans]MDT8759389.1 DUF4112 domain-containing protein [Sphingomonas psychrotolerans]
MASGLGAAAKNLPLGKTPADIRRRIEAMEQLLERSFTIPGTRFPVGLDVVLDLIPGIGTTVAAAMGAYIAWEARNLGMSKTQIARMAGNIGFDWAIGMIPWVGAIPDLFFRSNSRNLKIIKKHLDKHHPATATIEL